MVQLQQSLNDVQIFDARSLQWLEVCFPCHHQSLSFRTIPQLAAQVQESESSNTPTRRWGHSAVLDNLGACSHDTTALNNIPTGGMVIFGGISKPVSSSISDGFMLLRSNVGRLLGQMRLLWRTMTSIGKLPWRRYLIRSV